MRKYLMATLVGGSVSGGLWLASLQYPVLGVLSTCLGMWSWIAAVLSAWIVTQGDPTPSVQKGGLGGLLGGLFGAAIVTGAIAWFVYHDTPKLQELLAVAKHDLKVRGDYDRLPPSLRDAYDHPEVVQRNAIAFTAVLASLMFGVIGFVGGLLGAWWLASRRRPTPAAAMLPAGAGAGAAGPSPCTRPPGAGW